MTIQNKKPKCSHPLKTDELYLHIVLGVLMPPVGVAIMPNAIGVPLIENLLLTLVSPSLGILHALFLIIRYHFFTVPTIITSKTEVTAPAGDSEADQPQPIPGAQAVSIGNGGANQLASALIIPPAAQPFQPLAVIPSTPLLPPAIPLPQLSPSEEDRS